MMFETAKQRLEGCGYSVLPVQGEAMLIVFYPPDKQNHRRTEALTPQAIVDLAESMQVPGEDRPAPRIDIHKIGVIGRLVKTPMSADGDGVPKLQIVLEITGKGAVGSLPIDEIRDMLGQLILLQLNAVQIKFDANQTRA